MIQDILLFALLAAAALGCLFMLVRRGADSSSTSPAAATARRHSRSTILKPLHGDEAGLFENLASFCEQDYAGPVQIVFGVENPNDPAIAVVERLRAAYPGTALELVVEPRAVGSNPKIANLINMSAASPTTSSCWPTATSACGATICPPGRRARAPSRRRGHLPLLRDLDRQPVVASRATDHRQSFSAGRRGRRSAELARPCLGSTIALRRNIARRRSAASSRSPTAWPTTTRSGELCAARRAGDGAAVRGRPCLLRIVASPNCGGMSCAGRGPSAPSTRSAISAGP